MAGAQGPLPPLPAPSRPFPAASPPLGSPRAPPQTRWRRSSRRWPRPLSAPAPEWASGLAVPAAPAAGGTRAPGNSAPDTRGLRPRRVPGRTGAGAAGPPGQGAGTAAPAGHRAELPGVPAPGGAAGGASPPWSCGSGRPTAGFPASWGSPPWPPAERGASGPRARRLAPAGRSSLAGREGRL